MKPESTLPDVLAPAKLGPITLRNRVIKAATFEGMSPEALMTDNLIEYHRKVAVGGVGMTTLAYCAVAPEGRTERRQIYWRPEALPGLRRFTEAIHAEGAAASAQIGHAGPVADSSSTGLPALAPSRTMGLGGIVRQASEADISRITEAHVYAAGMAIEAGFDAIELHFGHNYFVSSFLSPKLNRRRDGWGGSLENRAKLARTVAKAVRARVGSQIAVIAKLNMADGIPGGISLEESIPFAKMLEQDGHLDALELTAGSSLLNPMFLFRGDVPLKEFAVNFKQPIKLGLQLFGRFFLRTYAYEEAYLLEMARQVRAEVKMPLVLLGGITNRQTMDMAMAEGFEYVAMGRALLREPDLLKRIAADAATRSGCTHCNQCMPTIYHGTNCVLVKS